MDLDIPYRFEGTTRLSEVVSRFSHIEAGEETGEQVRVAGRIMLLRVQGRLAFARLRDSSGEVQLFCLDGVTEAFEELKRRHLGDWVGADGEVIKTKRGELSVRVKRWQLLASARHGFGDKWRGITDPDVRYRQRELDLWANEGVRDRFLLRSRVVSAMRRLLEKRGFVEVETPILQPIPSGGHAKPFSTHYNALHADYYLRIAEELYLKRCVVGGIERVFEIGRIFRNEGVSPKYNPEFTMLEAYQAYADYHDVAELVEYLVAGITNEVLGTTVITYEGRELELTPPWRRVTLDDAIGEVTGREVRLEMGEEELRRVAAELDVELADRLDAGQVLLEIYEKTTEPRLWGPVHVMDYPESVSPLTRKHRSRPGYVERVTPIVACRELADGFSELVDADEQRRRFERQAANRLAGDEEAMLTDEDFLRALERGMPPTGGVGLGVDRLVMLLADVHHIKEILLFPMLRPGAGEEPPPEPGEVG